MAPMFLTVEEGRTSESPTDTVHSDTSLRSLEVPNIMNSVLSSFNLRKFSVIHILMSSMQASSLCIAALLSLGSKER